MAALGNLIENDTEDAEERRKKIQAQQAGSDLGAVLGLAIGAVIAANENREEVHHDEHEETNTPTMKL